MTQQFPTHCAVSSQWQRIGIKPHHGIDLPLFALRSKNSAGVGEFLDLIPLIDWCSELGLDVLQLLPLNDSDQDPSPYNALSSCALNPLFLSLHALPHLDQMPSLKEKLAAFQPFNETSRVTYHEVLNLKLGFLHTYIEQVGDKIFKSPPFTAYLAQNPWLQPYALFKTLKKQYFQKSWSDWPQEMKTLSQEDREKLTHDCSREISFYLLLQFLCFLQMLEVKKHAASKKVLLKGDIPILISPDSADVWDNQELFNLTLSAGAPPDFYNLNGQYWGFPLFNWDIMKSRGYAWWKQRLHYAEQFYDLYRIDHVVGFFRIWGIPLNHSGKEGKFVPENRALWIPEGKERLEAFSQSSSMLPMAEDLGTVPPEVHCCLQEMGICGTKVIRWERMWDEDKRFIPIQDYPLISMTTVSTHDSDTLQLWWKNSPEEAKDYARFKHWDYQPDLSIEQRRSILWDSHHSSSLFHINLLQEYLALFSELISPHPEDEQINKAGTFLPTNWTYRFRPSIDTLTTHPGLKKAIQGLLLKK